MKTQGQEIAEKMVRESDGHVLIERRDQPGHPYCVRVTAESPANRLQCVNQIVAAIAHEIDTAIAGEREACASIIRARGGEIRERSV